MKGTMTYRTAMALLTAVLLALPLRAAAADTAGSAAAGEEVDVKAIVLEHLSDSYWWHIGTFGGRDVSLYLPVIVRSSAERGGWHCFSSRHLADGASWEGFSIAAEGKYEGKIVETLPDGSTVRPFDLSVTKTVAALLLNSVIVLLVILVPAGWYRRHRHDVKAHPKGFTAFMEMAIEGLQDDLIKPCVGENWKRFSPYLLTVFFFILVCNFMSLIPFFPGGVNVTGNIAVTFVLALASFLVINIFGGRAYWKDIFWPDVPAWLKVPVPFMPVIEFIRHIHQAIRPDDPTLRQHGGRPCGHPLLSVHRLRDGRDGSRDERLDDGGFGAVYDIHECAGGPGGLPAGLRLHHAVGSLHRTGPGGED